MAISAESMFASMARPSVAAYRTSRVSCMARMVWPDLIASTMEPTMPMTYDRRAQRKVFS